MPELHWLGDGEAKREARRVPYRLLTPVEQVGDPTARNFLIQGDNVWARLSDRRCVFLMATHANLAGKSVAEQIREAINLS